MGLFRILLIALLIYFLYKIIKRQFLTQNEESSSSFFVSEEDENGKATQEGEVSIDYSPKYKNVIPPTEGEYVDYEEIKDKK